MKRDIARLSENIQNCSSNMKIETLQSAWVEPYDLYIKSQTAGSFYYSSKYKDFLKNLIGCKEEYLLAMEGDTICGILPLMFIERHGGRVYNSLPYYGSNGGIITQNPEAYQRLVSAYNEVADRPTTRSSTIISNPLLSEHLRGIHYNYLDYRIGQFTNLTCQGNPRDEIMWRIDSRARRNVKKAMREGVTVEIDHTYMDRLCQIHQENIRALNGIPKTNRFFSLVLRHFNPGQDFNLYVAKKDGVVIAGLLLFYFNQIVEYFTPAVSNEYRSIQPLSLILVTAMTDAAQSGFKMWNWGGTWKAQKSLYSFKKKWATMEQKYYYYTQLNDEAILSWSSVKIVRAFPNFFTVPFSVINSGGLHE